MKITNKGKDEKLVHNSIRHLYFRKTTSEKEVTTKLLKTVIYNPC